MTQGEINDAEWNDPTNWRWGVYYSPDDTRVWVAKRPKWAGWTLNFARPAAKWWLVALIAPGLLVAALSIAVAGW